MCYMFSYGAMDGIDTHGTVHNYIKRINIEQHSDMEHAKEVNLSKTIVPVRRV